MNTPWPPIIGIARVPWWARLRDAVLTALAWIALLSALSPLGLALWSGLQPALGPTQAQVFNLGYAWDVMRPYLRLAGMLSLWLVAFAIVRRHLYLTKRRKMKQPLVLSREEELDHLDVPPELAARLQEQRVSVVRFSAHGRIADVAAPDRSSGPAL